MKPYLMILLLMTSTEAFSASEIGKIRTFYQDDQGEWKTLPEKPQSFEGHLLGEKSGGLAFIGQALWDLVKENRSVYDEKIDHVSALPLSVEKPQLLQGWIQDESRPIRVLIEDTLGFDMVDFQYRLIYQHSGTYQGKGKYLANVTLVPDSLKIKAVGIQFSVRVRALDPYLIGDAPEAVLPLLVGIEINGLINSASKTDEFTVYGRGTYGAVIRSSDDWD